MQTWLQRFVMMVWLCSSIGFCSSDRLTIDRTGPKDHFTIPLAKCDKNNDVCSREYNALKYDHCDCVCGDHDATFSFYKQSWSCLGNKDTRRIFGCSQRTFFQDEDSTSKLSVLARDSNRQLSLTRNGRCKVNMASSWYMGCHGNKVFLREAANTFTIDSDSYLKLGLSSYTPLTGKVVNLGIRCNATGSTSKHCVLFKIEGKTNCPISPVPPTTKATVVTDAAEKSTFATEEVAGPNSAADKNDGAGFSSSSVALIAGVNVSLILVVVIIGFFVYRWKYSRHHPNTNREDQTSEGSQSSSRFGEQNPGYATLDIRNSVHYASNYVVPNDVCNAAPTSVEQPVYNIIEVLNPDTKEGSYDYISTEGHQNNAPLSSFEQPVYSLIEDLDTGTCESPANNSDPGYPVYNVLEEPLPDSAEEVDCRGSNDKQGPVYYVLEDTDHNKTDEPSCDPLENCDEDKSETFS